MVERDRRDAEQRLIGIDKRRTPKFDLLHIGQHVAVAEHGAFGHAGGATGVLQKSQVVRLQIDLAPGQLLAARQHVAKGHRTGQGIRRHHGFDLVHHKIGQIAFKKRHHVRQPADHNMAHRCVANDLRQRVGEQIDHHHGLHAGIAQLVLEFAGRVHRVHIDHHIAGTQQPKHAHRVLQHIGHHQSHPAALGQVQNVLEIAGHASGVIVQLGVAQLGAGGAADKSVTVGI